MMKETITEIVSPVLCAGCEACLNVCPRQAIRMEADQEGFLYPVVDNTKCIHCGKCVKMCPVLLAEKDHGTYGKTDTFVGYAKDESMVLKSSSGGFLEL